MKASKKEFEQLVLLIRALEKDPDRRIVWANGLANILETSNPLFDRKRFIRAAQGIEEKT